MLLKECLSGRFWYMEETTENKKAPANQYQGFCAEGEGFEPPVPRGTTVFKTAAFDHSANSL